MMRKFIWLFSVVIFCFADVSSTKQDPCNDFYDYICVNDDRKIPKFKSTNLDEFREVQKPNITFTNNGTFVPIKKLINMNRVIKWISELEVLDHDSSDLDPDYLQFLNEDEQFQVISERLETIILTTFNKFYNALHANLEILQALKPPVARQNPFLHHLFQTMKNEVIEDIKNTNLTEKDKKHLIFEIHATHAFYAFFDVNNISMIQEAKNAYELEYYRLKSLVSEIDQKDPLFEKLNHIGAIDAAMKATNKYTGFYFSSFLFAAIVANPSDDAFQYSKYIHITTITRNDPKQFEKAIADAIFVSAHEILHKLYPFGIYEIGLNTTTTALKCAEKEIKKLAETDAVQPPFGWYNDEGNSEDIVNIMALRVIMKMMARKSKDQEQLKSSLEILIGGICKQVEQKNQPIPRHNPFELSLNTAIRQYPLFSTLYGCKAGDRMFANKSEYCNPVGEDVNLEDFKIPSNSTGARGFFKEWVDNSKMLGFTYGNF